MSFGQELMTVAFLLFSLAIGPILPLKWEVRKVKVWPTKANGYTHTKSEGRYVFDIWGYLVRMLVIWGAYFLIWGLFAVVS